MTRDFSPLIKSVLAGVQKKRTKTSRTEVCIVIVVKSNLFVRFSEELRMPKSPFEIN